MLGPGDATSLLAHRDCMHTSGTSCSCPLGPWGGMVYKEEEVQWRREFWGKFVLWAKLSW